MSLHNEHASGYTRDKRVPVASTHYLTTQGS